MKGLQKRNIGSHHLRSRGYGGKRSKWAKEDAEAASLGIPDPLAEFTVPEERDVKSKYMKGLQKRNIGSHHLRSRGYGGKRSKWAKEDAEAASLGIPDPLAEFTVPEERDVLRARHRWDPVKKVFETNAVTRSS